MTPVPNCEASFAPARYWHILVGSTGRERHGGRSREGESRQDR
jgi:hypothetical protein